MRTFAPAAVIVFLLLFCPAAFADGAMDAPSTESLLVEYAAILKKIETERAALEEERARIVEERCERALDNRLIDEFTILVDRSMARLDEEKRRLDADRAWVEREREKLIAAQRTPVRTVTIENPYIRADLHEKISRYWWN